MFYLDSLILTHESQASVKLLRVGSVVDGVKLTLLTANVSGKMAVFEEKVTRFCFFFRLN